MREQHVNSDRTWWLPFDYESNPEEQVHDPTHSGIKQVPVFRRVLVVVYETRGQNCVVRRLVGQCLYAVFGLYPRRNTANDYVSVHRA